MDALPLDEAERARRRELIETYLRRFAHVDEVAEQTTDHNRLNAIRQEILALMAEADAIAERLRIRAAAT